MDEKTKTKVGIYVSFLLGIVLTFGLLLFLSSTVVASEHDNFAQCLGQKNVTMYGAFWCPHCEAQKEFFGNSFKYVKYVECSTPDLQMTDACKAQNISSYPTWKFDDGTTISGETNLENLSLLSGCSLEKK